MNEPEGFAAYLAYIGMFVDREWIDRYERSQRLLDLTDRLNRVQRRLWPDLTAGR